MQDMDNSTILVVYTFKILFVQCSYSFNACLWAIITIYSYILYDMKILGNYTYVCVVPKSLV